MAKRTRLNSSTRRKLKASFTKRIMVDGRKRRGVLCFWCGRPLPIRLATFDHVVPLSKGGSNSRKNQVMACKGCNRARGDSLGPPPRDASKEANMG